MSGRRVLVALLLLVVAGAPGSGAGPLPGRQAPAGRADPPGAERRVAGRAPTRGKAPLSAALRAAEIKRIRHWRSFQSRHPDLYQRVLERNKAVRDLMKKAETMPPAELAPVPASAEVAGPAPAATPSPASLAAPDRSAGVAAEAPPGSTRRQ